MKETKRELVEYLLEQPTRIQLGKLVQINGIQLFQVVYELDNTAVNKPQASQINLEADEFYHTISIDDLDKLKESTGLTVRLITLIHNMETETTDVYDYNDEYGGTFSKDVLTDVEVKIKYTIY
jgi:hypothetical protein